VAAGTCDQVLVCTNRSCKKKGSLKVLEHFQALAPSSVEVMEGGCYDECSSGPNVQVNPKDLILHAVKTKADVAALLEEHCLDSEGLVAKVASEPDEDA